MKGNKIMEELEIKFEPECGDGECNSDTPDSLNCAKLGDTGDNTVVTNKKKRRMEIELDFSLVKSEYYYKQRERRPVKRYDDIILEAETQRIQTKNMKLTHKLDNKKEESFFCELCNMQFHGVKHFTIHKQQKHNKGLTYYTCALCSATFKSNHELINHKNIHKDEDKNFLCIKCKTAFSDHLEYLKHKAKHIKKSVYYCIECGKEFGKRSSYNVHIETHYYRMQECEICHKKTSKIKEHMKTHNEKYKAKCVECGKEFNDSSYMKYHMVSHTGVKPYQCLYCGKGFGNLQQRTVHTRYHTGEKPYKCEICHRAYAQTADLHRHKASHVTPHTTLVKCDICNKKFKHQESLKLHMDVHNNTQKYSCSFCEYKCHTNTGLRSHIMRAHTEQKKYKCVPCEVAFKTSSDLKKHCKWKKHINNLYGYEKKNKSKEE